MPRYRAMLAGKVAIVTGAGSGIGRATARRFAAEGATVIAADLDLDAAEETCAGLDNATAARVDVTAARGRRERSSPATTASTSTSTTPASRRGSSRSPS